MIFIILVTFFCIISAGGLAIIPFCMKHYYLEYIFLLPAIMFWLGLICTYSFVFGKYCMDKAHQKYSKNRTKCNKPFFLKCFIIILVVAIVSFCIAYWKYRSIYLSFYLLSVIWFCINILIVFSRKTIINVLKTRR